VAAPHREVGQQAITIKLDDALDDRVGAQGGERTRGRFDEPLSGGGERGGRRLRVGDDGADFPGDQVRPERGRAGTLEVMILAPAPSLVFVVGLPAGLMVCVGVVGVIAWVLIGRISRS